MELRTPLLVRIRRCRTLSFTKALCGENTVHLHVVAGSAEAPQHLVLQCAARYHEKLMLASQHSVALVAAFARHSDLAQQPSAQSTFDPGALLLCLAIVLPA